MNGNDKKIKELTSEFAGCQKLLAAMGDENRQHIMLEMMQMGECDGVRVGDIARRSNLSRPAVSHHLQILKDAGILKVRHEGTKNFYYFDHEAAAFKKLIGVMTSAKDILESLPDSQKG